MHATDLIIQAIALAGSEAKLGAAAGFSQNAIWNAKRKGRVSAELAVGIDRATNGVVSKSMLRPDLFPV
jgi:DNA-binding transcriptional regulator YdaS (Cro superfamily)